MSSRLLSLAAFLLVSVSIEAAKPGAQDLETLQSAFSKLIDDNVLVGAQLIVGRNESILLERNYGVRSVADKTPVDQNTQFCIGSCSKPYVSACIMALVQDKKLELDETIDAILPQFGNLTMKETGRSIRPPTLRELLCHRGGIYSQKLKLTRRQKKWIRNYTLSLKTSVDGIGRERLIASPGEKYAYSGAGYCVIGRLAEVAAKKSFERIMQEKICEPLDLKRTTYFPRADDPNIATGSLDGKINPATPHLFKPFNLILVGGSLYSTARDSSRFVQMMIDQERSGQEIIHRRSTFKEYMKKHFNNGDYGMGWKLMRKNKKTIGLNHGGSLASSRAFFLIDFRSGKYGVVLYTLSNPKESDPLNRAIRASIFSVVVDEN